jgi:hypothetical protein
MFLHLSLYAGIFVKHISPHQDLNRQPFVPKVGTLPTQSYHLSFDGINITPYNMVILF